MPRITLPPGDAPESYRLFSLQPALGKALAGLSEAIYSQTVVDLRVREAVRMRIAHINECLLCVGFRFPQKKEEFTAMNINEDFYAAIPQWRTSTLFSERERLAIEYAEKFAENHLSIDDNFIAGLGRYFSGAEIFALTTIIAGLMANGRILQVLQVQQDACAMHKP
jgi:alkylhydroperoxidase family enzyme